ncbi:hypothetical protein [Pseudomonas mosselii]|uniref:hypothetical protein n=1 Tax=Pseudomonas mosselii TaxID=78327 RepID=UPI001F3ADF31|nr:hypothetical protein [Pseudomonas mosselii]
MSLTDRELLELAARAAGLNINQAFQAQRDAAINPAKASLWIDDGSTAWNPLVDDGHALRLAVKLGIKLRFHPVLCQALAWIPLDTEIRVGVEECSDASSATRRAIVLAAAQIGKAMQEKQ